MHLHKTLHLMQVQHKMLKLHKHQHHKQHKLMLQLKDNKAAVQHKVLTKQHKHLVTVHLLTKQTVQQHKMQVG
ncbi:hypothetical protein DN475_34095 [Burkholderia multivorans]|nr:hypothetical protein DN475_34095 [Burkholderia multivorans]